MLKSTLVAAAGALGLALSAGGSYAAILSTFDTGNEGFKIGSMDSSAAVQGDALWNAGGYLETTDEAAEVAFFASDIYLGDQSAAYGTAISYDTSDNENDGVLYAALVLYGAGQAISIGHLPPVDLEHFSFTLTETSFLTYGGAGIQSGSAVSEATFRAVLADLTGIAFHADWRSGSDDSTLDNVRAEGFTAGGADAVPEPATWALMILGFGLAGSALRRRELARA